MLSPLWLITSGMQPWLAVKSLINGSFNGKIIYEGGIRGAFSIATFDYTEVYTCMDYNIIQKNHQSETKLYI
jgi:hypothetical protein